MPCNVIYIYVFFFVVVGVYVCNMCVLYIYRFWDMCSRQGSARADVFRYQHEVRAGHTSSISHELLGFDASGAVVCNVPFSF